MLKICFAILCLLSIAEAKLVIPPNFQLGFVEWHEYRDEPKTKVVNDLKKRYPTIPIRVVNESTYEGKYVVDADFEKIKVSVDKYDKVVRTPVYTGLEPNLKLAEKLLGQFWYPVIMGLRDLFPDTMILLYLHGHLVKQYAILDKTRNYIRVEAEWSTVRKMPTFVWGFLTGGKELLR